MPWASNWISCPYIDVITYSFPNRIAGTYMYITFNHSMVHQNDEFGTVVILAGWYTLYV